MADDRELTKLKRRPAAVSSLFGHTVPKIIAAEGPEAAKRFLEFFTANIRNRNTRAAYAHAVGQFCACC